MIDLLIILGTVVALLAWALLGNPEHESCRPEGKGVGRA